MGLATLLAALVERRIGFFPWTSWLIAGNRERYTTLENAESRCDVFCDERCYWPCRKRA